MTNYRRTYYQTNKARENRVNKQNYLDNRETRLAKIKAYQRTWRGWATLRWSLINSRTVNGSHPRWKEPKSRRYLEQGIRLEFTRAEFQKWCEERGTQIEEMIAAGQRPSIDRVDPTRHYALDNLQIVPFRENCRKTRSPRRDATKTITS